MRTPTEKTVQHSGEYGNLSVAVGKVIFEGDASGASGVAINLPFSSLITGAYFVNEALGASTLVSITAVNEEETLQIIPASSTSSAGKVERAEAPISLKHDSEIRVNLSGAAATGAVDLVITYQFIGG